jgi:hypothetical protein
MTLAHATPQPGCVRIRRKQTAARVMMGTPVPRPTAVSRESASDPIRSPVPQVINVTMPVRAMRRPDSVRIRKKRMAARVMTATPALRVTLVSPAHASDRIQSPARRAISVTMRARAMRQLECAQIRRRQTAPPVTMATLVRRPTVVSRECALDPIPSPVRRATNVTTPARATRLPESARTRQRRMVLHVMTETPVPKLIVASREHALDRIQSLAARAINVTTPVHAMRQPACVRIHQKQTAARVMMETLARRPTAVSRECAPAPTRLLVRRVINAITPAHAIRLPECVPIRQKRMAPHVMTAMLVPKPMPVSRERASDPIQSPARAATSVTMLEHAIRKLGFVRIHQRQTAQRAMTEMSVRRTTSVRQVAAPARLRLATVRLELKAIGRVIPKPGACRQ